MQHMVLQRSSHYASTPTPACSFILLGVDMKQRSAANLVQVSWPAHAAQRLFQLPANIEKQAYCTGRGLYAAEAASQAAIISVIPLKYAPLHWQRADCRAC